MERETPQDGVKSRGPYETPRIVETYDKEAMADLIYPRGTRFEAFAGCGCGSGGGGGCGCGGGSILAASK